MLADQVPDRPYGFIVCPRDARYGNGHHGIWRVLVLQVMSTQADQLSLDVIGRAWRQIETHKRPRAR
jgi:hypothetical protein